MILVHPIGIQLGAVEFSVLVHPHALATAPVIAVDCASAIQASKAILALSVQHTIILQVHVMFSAIRERPVWETVGATARVSVCAIQVGHHLMMESRRLFSGCPVCH